MEVSGQLHAPAALPQGKSPCYPLDRRGGWVGTRAILDTVVKRKILSPRRESNPRIPIVQPVAQCYTNWAITALFWRVWIGFIWHRIGTHDWLLQSQKWTLGFHERGFSFWPIEWLLASQEYLCFGELVRLLKFDFWKMVLHVAYMLGVTDFTAFNCCW
jgi:hypothetical protein